MSEDQTAPEVPNDDSGKTTDSSDSGGELCLDAITSEVDGLASAMSVSRYARIILVIVVLAFVGYLTMTLKSFAESLSDEEFTNSLVDEAKGQYFGPGDPEELLQKETKQLGDSIVQTLQSALKAQLDQDLEEYKGIISIERETLAKNMEARLNQIFNERYAEALNNHEKVLREKFPDFNDEQVANLVANLETAMNQVLLEHYQHEIQGKLNELYKNYDDFPVAMPHTGEGTVEDAFFSSAATVGINMLKDIEAGASSDAAPAPTPPPVQQDDAAPAEKAAE